MKKRTILKLAASMAAVAAAISPAGGPDAGGVG